MGGTLTFADIEQLTGFTLGTFDVACPECGPACRAPSNRKRPVLRIWRKEPGFATYLCVRCGLQGRVCEEASHRSSVPRPLPAAPVVDDDAAHRARQARKALFLWQSRRPANDSPVEKYLRDIRGYGGTIPSTIAYLPPNRPDHHPAMIAAFGCAIEPEPGVIKIDTSMVRGIHLTLLRPDGLGKAGADRDKLMVGPSSGWPIVLAPPNNSMGMVVTEGIETGLSIHEATGLGVWAAGAAGRMPALADKVPNWIDSVTIAAEADEAGQQGAGELARRLRDRGLHFEWRFLDGGRAA